LLDIFDEVHDIEQLTIAHVVPWFVCATAAKTQQVKESIPKPARRSSISVTMTAMAQSTNPLVVPWSSQLWTMLRHICAVSAIPTRESYSPKISRQRYIIPTRAS
jgi:hypothetical protein